MGCGAFAIFQAATGHFLPHDAAYLGMTASELCALHSCRILHFMIHDRVSFGGVLVAIGVLYMWLASFPLRRRESWAWWALALSSLAGFLSFLSYLGYGSLDSATWVAPRPAEELDALLKEAGVGFERFTAAHTAGTSGAAALVRRAWDLRALADAYDRFVAHQSPAMAALAAGSSDEAAYAARFRLVHAWRTFLFRDPQLPPALLPEAWPGAAAAQFFDRHEARLRPAADRFVDRCLR